MLKQEGLSTPGRRRDGRYAERQRIPRGLPEAVSLWTAWARAVLKAGRFPNDRARAIWALYAQGRSYTEIQSAVGCSRRRVSWAIGLVEAAAPPKPCLNPWRHWARTERNADPRISYYNARRERRRAASQPQHEEDDFWIS